MSSTLISYMIGVVLRLSFLNFLFEGKRIVPYAHGFWAHRVACFLRKCRVPPIACYTRGGCRGRRPSGENAWSMLDGDPARHGIRPGSMKQYRAWTWRLRRKSGVPGSRPEYNQQ